MYEGEAELYCTAFAWDVGEEVDWLLELSARRIGRPPRRVLEPLCGNARYGPAFADRGLSYTGFDRSRDMLDRAAVDPRLELLEADAHDFPCGSGPFDLAFCPINSLRHLPSVEDLTRHLARVGSALAPGAVYVVQLALFDHDGPWPQAPEAQHQWSLDGPDGIRVDPRWWVEQVDRARRTAREGYRFERRRSEALLEAVEGHYRMLALSIADWRAAVRDAGLALVEAHQHTSPPSPIALEAIRDDGQDNVYFVLSASPC